MTNTVTTSPARIMDWLWLIPRVSFSQENGVSAFPRFMLLFPMTFRFTDQREI